MKTVKKKKKKIVPEESRVKIYIIKYKPKLQVAKHIKTHSRKTSACGSPYWYHGFITDISAKERM